MARTRFGSEERPGCDPAIFSATRGPATRDPPGSAPRDPSDPAILPALVLPCVLFCPVFMLSRVYVFSCDYVSSCVYVSGAPGAVSSDGANKTRGRERRPPSGARPLGRAP